MENSTNTGWSANKIFRVAAILLLLIGLPAGSWYYLSGGVNWRKTALNELRGHYGQIASAYIMYPDGTKEDRLKSKVCVIHLFGDHPDLTDVNRKVLDTGQKLFEQFGKNENFRVALISENATAEFRSYMQKLPCSDYATWVSIGGVGQWTTVVRNGYEYYLRDTKEDAVPEYYALCDTAGTIRRFYDANNEKEVGRMVEQITILLPPSIQ